MLADRVRVGRKIEEKLVAGDVIAYEANGEVGANSLTFTIKRRVRVYRNGTIRITFNLRSERGGGRHLAQGRVVINGIDVGKLQHTSSTEYSSFTEDFTVKKGDHIALYLNSFSTDSYAFNNLFQISLAEPVPSDIFETTL